MKKHFTTINPEVFWRKVRTGWTPPRHCTLVMKDGKTHWGYPIISHEIFDHPKQGLSHKQQEIVGGVNRVRRFRDISVEAIFRIAAKGLL